LSGGPRESAASATAGIVGSNDGRRTVFKTLPENGLAEAAETLMQKRHIGRVQRL
jgi:hypothetical protein